METVREQVYDFTRACQALAEFVHHNRLTEKERLVVVSFARALELDIEPPIPRMTYPWRQPSPTCL
jgi:hypothetical protein